MIDIYVPTYGRKSPKILQFLKDENIRLHLCVRHETLKEYEHLVSNERISLVDLGTGIEDIGETRKRVVSHCISEGLKYCIMFDDGLTKISDRTKKDSTISSCIEEAIDFLKRKQKEHEEVFCYTFYRLGNDFLGVHKTDEYFVGFPLQAEIIDLDYIRKYKINFKSMKEVGLEDIAFFVDAVKEGLIFVSDQDINIEGKLPNVIEEGGNHQEDVTAFEKKRDESHKTLMRYVGNMYGIMLAKKYRESLGFCLTYAKIDFSYFRDVLVFHRKENKKIIDNKFMIED